MLIDYPKQVDTVLQTLEEQGFQAYLVGGCVRDALLGTPPKDWDVATDARPEEVLRCFKGYTVVTTGSRYGTVTIVIDKLPVEVTTFRTESNYSDNRRPDRVLFVEKLRDDLSRRDFTVNALAYRNGELLDYFSGQNDLKAHLIRCVGNADTRFREDALRILRALRFASILGFGLETSTANSLQKNRELLLQIAPERIFSELKQLLIGENTKPILRDYRDVFAVFLPELKTMFDFCQNNPHHCFDVWIHTIEAIGASKKKLSVRLALLFHDIGKPIVYTTDEKGVGHFYGHPAASVAIARTALKRLRCDNQTLETVLTLIQYHDAELSETAASLKKWLNKLGPTLFFDLLEIKKADAKAQHPDYTQDRLNEIEAVEITAKKVLAQRQPYRIQDLAIDGNDLLEIGIAKGPQIGAVLNMLLDEITKERLPNEKAALLRRARELDA